MSVGKTGVPRYCPHVSFTAADVQVAVSVAKSGIARVKPTVFEKPRRAVGDAVAARESGAMNDERSQLAITAVVPIGIYDAHLIARRHFARGFEAFWLLETVVRCGKHADDPALAGAVQTDQYRAAEAFEEPGTQAGSGVGADVADRDERRYVR